WRHGGVTDRERRRRLVRGERRGSRSCGGRRRAAGAGEGQEETPQRGWLSRVSAGRSGTDSRSCSPAVLFGGGQWDQRTTPSADFAGAQAHLIRGWGGSLRRYLSRASSGRPDGWAGV